MEPNLHPISQKILKDFQPRKTKAQKQAFIDWLYPALLSEGIQMVVESDRALLEINNLVVGNPEDCDVVVAAHYDTAPRLPFPNFIVPRNILLTLLIQTVMVLLPLALWQGLMIFLTGIFENIPLNLFLLLQLGFPILYMGMLLFGPANKNTANDNTSGIITVIETMLRMSPQERERVCFVLFDLEEVGMFGSSAFKRSHFMQMEKVPLINLDCVSDGDHLLLVLSRAAHKIPQFKQQIQTVFEQRLRSNPEKTLQIDPAWRTFYPSDQMHFKSTLAIVALKRAPLIGLYLDKIHTRRDTNFDKDNIHIISRALSDLLTSHTLQPQNLVES